MSPKIIETRSKTGFLGFLIGMESFKNMYFDYCENTNKLEYILKYKCSQDHIEAFFSAVRSRGGWDNNPTVTEITTSYKRLLVRNEIRSSSNANFAQDDIQILSVSSGVNAAYTLNGSSNTLQTVNEDDYEENLGDDDFDIPLYLINTEIEEVVLYIAGSIERKVRKLSFLKLWEI